MKNFTINWAEYLIAGNPMINPKIGDSKQIRCVGETKILADNKFEAIRQFKIAFPKAYILN